MYTAWFMGFLQIKKCPKYLFANMYSNSDIYLCNIFFPVTHS